jgi:hypothetical protein
MAVDLTHVELIWGKRHANPTWREYTGVPAETWHAAVVPDDLARCTHALTDALRLGVPARCEARLRASTGEPRWFRIVFSPAGDGDWYACAYDLDGRAAAGRARRWVATLAHELRAPLSSLLLWTRVLRDPDLCAEQRVQALQAIHDGALAQLRLVDDLVQLSRSANGRLHLDARCIELAPIVRAAVEAASLAGAARRIAVTADLGTRPCWAFADAQRVRQILDNVLLNALRFCHDGGTIAAKMQSSDEVTRVIVRDDGDGIPGELLPHIFEPFVGSAGSLGLGLAIARELAVLHGGSLDAHSAGLGHGAVFTLELPLAVGDDADRVEVRAPANLDGIRLLVIDDDAHVRAALAILLARAGASEVAVTAVADATAVLARVQPAAVICDPATPRDDIAANVPVIALRRPIDLDLLIQAIRGALHNPE